MPSQSRLSTRVLELVHEAGALGMTMGALVDQLEAEGYRVKASELEIWGLLERRELTPHGFVCRTFRSAAGSRRGYELLLICWSPQQDRQSALAKGM